MDPEEFYRRVGRLIEAAPPFLGSAPLSAEELTWLGRASALMAESTDVSARAIFELGVTKLNARFQRQNGFQEIMMSLYRVLAAAELKAPASAQGAFIPVGSSFDAYAAVAKVLGRATQGAFIVDPYMDDTVLVDFGGTISENVPLRLLGDQATAKPNLAPAAKRWKAQYPTRPLEVRLAPPRVLHDRAIFIDGSEAWTVTQSLKDLAKRSPAEIVRADDIAPLKIAAYEAIWLAAVPIV